MKFLRLTVLVVFAGLVLVLTTQPESVPIVYLASSTIGSTDFGGALGHAGLFFLLTLAVFTVLRTRFAHRIALPVAMSTALTLATMTELYQRIVPDRSFSLVDLLANWLGVFVIGFIISYANSSQEGRINL